VPARDESVNFDTTENLIIEGDNLETLKLLQKSYLGQVKMIYIDPPYNTGNDFIYPDDYSESLDTYLRYTGQVDNEGRKFSTNTETDGRFHSKWMNMMYPRLFLARNLLKEDGVIFISIDDCEVSNLRKICDEVFGEDNFRNCILVRRRVKSLNSQFAENGLRTLNVGFEYVLVYSKNDSFLMKSLRMEKINPSTTGRWDVFWSNADRPTMRYDVLGFTPESGQWRYSAEKAQNAVKNYQKYLENYADKMSLEEYWAANESNMQFIRRIPDGIGKNGGVQHWVPPSETALRTSNWLDIEVSQIHKEIDLPFNNPKSTKLIVELVKLADVKNGIVLDFFAGSGTTAQAVLEQNKEDNGNRKFILVQLPEPIEQKDFKTIADITKERIRLVIKKLNDEDGGKLKLEKGAKLDRGFKVFKLQSSNFKAWNTEQPKDDAELVKQLTLHVDHLVAGRSQEGVLYELLIKSGFPLDTKVEKITLAGKSVFAVADSAMLICLEKELTPEVIKAMAEKKPERVVCLDAGFADNDQLKTNAVQTMKSKGVTKFQTV
jgi:adenine-specific DNA-methyltransferase